MSSRKDPQKEAERQRKIELYDGIVWSTAISNTLTDGIPAHGNGDFSSCCGYCCCLFSFCGCAGCHHYYLGDNTCCWIYCFTWGLCYLGLLYDCFTCYIPRTVVSLNSEINSKLAEKKNADTQIVVMVQGQSGDPTGAQQSYPAYPPATDLNNPQQVFQNYPQLDNFQQNDPQFASAYPQTSESDFTAY